MNKKLYFSVCVCIMCVFFAVWSIILSVKVYDLSNAQVQNKDANVTPIDITPVSDEIEGYLVKYEKGEVNLYSVFKSGKKTFGQTLNISTFAMRESDKKAFENGIMLESKEDVLHLIEDYSS